MATKTEFIATGRDNEAIAKALGVDHLVYLKRDAMNEAGRAGNPKIEKFCNACFTGEYPTGDITLERMNKIAEERAQSQNTGQPAGTKA
jgi:amidophosphoribosyltransferase